MKEIREEVRKFILNEVLVSLARIGVDCDLMIAKTYEDKCYDTLLYLIESTPITHTPMMFKNLTVTGNMHVMDIKEDSIFFKASQKRDIIRVELDYSYEHFGSGHNGCTLGNMIFQVEKDLPETFGDGFGEDVGSYIRKAKGLEV